MVRCRSLHVLLVLCALHWEPVLGKKQRTSRDWSKMTDADWQEIEKEWETPEEKEEYEFRPPPQKGLDMEALQREIDKIPKKKGKKAADKRAQKMQALIAEKQQSSGPVMMFATVDYEGCCTEKKGTDELASKWSSLMSSASVEQSPYVVSNDSILFTSQAQSVVHEIKSFLLAQPEVVAVEINQVRTPGPAETPEWKAKDAVRKAAQEAERAKKDRQKAAEEKRNKKKVAKKAKRKTKKEVQEDKLEL
mmetsp:Transcript_8251/g.18097  ORF Transcript_8251/g.18097 Transcript_8251/m.18097 type:complete len:249 (-) Transcript_8251:173-919(-)